MEYGKCRTPAKKSRVAYPPTTYCPSAAASGGVRIVSAQYGEGHNRLDVTSRLRSMVRDGRISIRVDNRTMGSDPAVGRPKILWVTYYVGGHGQRELKVYENEQLMLP